MVQGLFYSEINNTVTGEKLSATCGRKLNDSPAKGGPPQNIGHVSLPGRADVRKDICFRRATQGPHLFCFVFTN